MAGEQLIVLLRLFPSLFSHISSFASALDVFSDRSGPVFRDDASTVPDATDAAPSRGFVPAVGSRDSHIVTACFVPDPSEGILNLLGLAPTSPSSPHDDNQIDAQV